MRCWPGLVVPTTGLDGGSGLAAWNTRCPVKNTATPGRWNGNVRGRHCFSNIPLPRSPPLSLDQSPTHTPTHPHTPTPTPPRTCEHHTLPHMCVTAALAPKLSMCPAGRCFAGNVLNHIETDNVSAAPAAGSDAGSRSVTSTVVEPSTGLREVLTWTLAPGSAALQTEVAIHNPTVAIQRYAHWVNAPFVPGGRNELTDNTELLVPTKRINISARWQVSPDPKHSNTAALGRRRNGRRETNKLRTNNLFREWPSLTLGLWLASMV